MRWPAHGRVRATKDRDVWIRATPENAERVYRALASFGAPLQNLSVDDLAGPEWTIEASINSALQGETRDSSRTLLFS